MKVYARMRLSHDANTATVWLIRRDGSASSGLLWGEMPVKTAEELLGFLDLKDIHVERDSVKLPKDAGPPAEEVMAKQAKLFQPELFQ